MKVLRCLFLLFVGIVTSVVFLSVAFKIDFKLFASDVAHFLTKGNDYYTATVMISRSDNEPLEILPLEVDGVSVETQVTIQRSLTNVVQVTGVVASWEEAESVRQLCKEMFPLASVRNELKVFENASGTSWMPALKKLAEISNISKVRNATLTLDSRLVEMSGKVATDETRKSLLAAIRASETSAHGDQWVVNLSVQPIEPEFDLWVASGETMLIQGVLNPQSRKTLLNLVNRHLSEGRHVIETIAVEIDAPTPPWLSGVASVIPQFLVHAEPRQLKVKDGEIILRGKVPGEAAMNVLSQYLTDAAPEGYKVQNGLTLEHGAVTKGRAIVATSSSTRENDANKPKSQTSLGASAIFFRVGSTRLGSRDKSRLAALASTLPPNGILELRGHSDPSGDPQANLRLSERRCDVVKNYLLELGLPTDRLRTRAMGSGLQTHLASSEQRRVEFHMVPAKVAAVESEHSSPITPVAKMAAPSAFDATVALANQSKIFFKTASSKIERTGREKLDKLAVALNSLPAEAQLTIRGLADPRGNSDYNLQLSKRRCEAAQAYLVSKGVNGGRMQLEERGATTVDISDPNALRDSRRVEFVIVLPKTAAH